MLSQDAPFLRDRANVTGSVFTTAPQVERQNAALPASVTTDLPLRLPTFDEWGVARPDFGQGWVTLSPDSREALAPGGYGNYGIHSRSELTLSSGTYAFQSLSFEPQSVLRLDTSGGPVVIVVKDRFTWRGEVAESLASQLIVIVEGESRVFVERPFAGTIVAPRGGITLQGGGRYVGGFYAEDVTVHPEATVVLEPFAGWGTVVPEPELEP